MRVAVILPQPYRGGTLRAGRDVASMLKIGRGAPLDVVFATVGGPLSRQDQREFDERGISVRQFSWYSIHRSQALQMASLAHRPVEMDDREERYVVPRDGAADLGDCDFWLFLSDRVPAPVLPLRPYGAIVFDALQRYVPWTMADAAWQSQKDVAIPFLRRAAVVLVTTPVTGADVQVFFGVRQQRICLAPLTFTPPTDSSRPAWTRPPYILWSTNCSPHKNHEVILRGLQRYYDDHRGQLDTVILGVETDFLNDGREHPHATPEQYVKPIRRLIHDTRALRSRITIAGEVSDATYREMMAGAHLLLHSSLYDNGTFAALDAAALGTPTLSARYPAMEYFDREYSLGLHWFDSHDSDDIATKLAYLETNATRSEAVPGRFADLAWTRNADAFRDILAPWLNARP